MSLLERAKDELAEFFALQVMAHIDLAREGAPCLPKRADVGIIFEGRSSLTLRVRVTVDFNGSRTEVINRGEFSPYFGPGWAERAKEARAQLLGNVVGQLLGVLVGAMTIDQLRACVATDPKGDLGKAARELAKHDLFVKTAAMNGSGPKKAKRKSA